MWEEFRNVYLLITRVWLSCVVYYYYYYLENAGMMRREKIIRSKKCTEEERVSSSAKTINTWPPALLRLTNLWQKWLFAQSSQVIQFLPESWEIKCAVAKARCQSDQSVYTLAFTGWRFTNAGARLEPCSMPQCVLNYVGGKLKSNSFNKEWGSGETGRGGGGVSTRCALGCACLMFCRQLLICENWLWGLPLLRRNLRSNM